MISKNIWSAIDSDAGMAILDSTEANGSDWGEGGCAILAFALKQIWADSSLYVIYNHRLGRVEHFGVRKPNGLIVDSLVLNKNQVVAVGNNLQHDSDFSSYPKIDMSGLTITPGFVDAHTHFYYMALSYNRVWLQALNSAEACLEKIREHAKGLGKNEWVVGEGFELNLFKKNVELTRQMLDNFTGANLPTFPSNDI